MRNNQDTIGQESSQLGLHFEPDKLLGSVSYPVTQTYWAKYRDQFITSPKAVQLVIESGYHTLGEMEHNSPEDVRGVQDLEMVVLVIDELVKLVIERFET